MECQEVVLAPSHAGRPVHGPKDEWLPGRPGPAGAIPIVSSALIRAVKATPAGGLLAGLDCPGLTDAEEKYGNSPGVDASVDHSVDVHSRRWTHDNPHHGIRNRTGTPFDPLQPGPPK